MAKGRVPATKIPTIGGSQEEHQAARLIVEYLKPALEHLNEQMAALDVIQDDTVKRVEKLEKRNNIKLTIELSAGTKGFLQGLFVKTVMMMNQDGKMVTLKEKK